MPRKLTKKSTVKKSPTDIAIAQAVDVAVNEALSEVGTNKFTCPACGRLLKRTDFYMTTDPVMKTGVSTICKQCAYDIAHPTDSTGKATKPTRESIIDTLQRLDRPFIQTLFESSVKESQDMIANGNTMIIDAWGTYIKNISMPQYRLLRYKDSDFASATAINTAVADSPNEDRQHQIAEEMEQNRKDTIRLLGYDPFENEQDDDKPYLYAQLISYLDASGEANSDGLRVSSIIEIVLGFSHTAKLNQQLSMLMSDPTTLAANANTIKAIEQIKSNITTSIQKLAEESCISLKNSKNASKGENTWTGKVKQLKEIDLDEARVNLFDVETAQGMEQVAHLSNRALIQEIGLDENDERKVIIEQREMITKLNKQAKSAEETARILLKENYDLKATLKEQHLL